jgi:hypothetical protein
LLSFKRSDIIDENAKRIKTKTRTLNLLITMPQVGELRNNKAKIRIIEIIDEYIKNN